jgi:hypothetical protein
MRHVDAFCFAAEVHAKSVHHSRHGERSAANEIFNPLTSSRPRTCRYKNTGGAGKPRHTPCRKGCNTPLRSPLRFAVNACQCRLKAPGDPGQTGHERQTHWHELKRDAKELFRASVERQARRLTSGGSRGEARRDLDHREGDSVHAHLLALPGGREEGERRVEELGLAGEG